MDAVRLALEGIAAKESATAPCARYTLALLHLKGHGVEKDSDAASRLMRQAADAGLVDAQLNFGFMAAKGDGVAQDDMEAARYFGLAAAQGNGLACFNLSRLYHAGRGFPESKEESSVWLVRAAEAGHAGAQFELGTAALECREGEDEPTAEAFSGAAKWWGLAAAQGHAEAACNLGCLFKEGKGVGRSDERAGTFLNIWLCGGSTNVAALACELAVLSLTPFRPAAVLFEQSAQAGSADGAFNLAYFYANGVLTDPDTEVAQELLALAARKGHEAAGDMLRDMRAAAATSAAATPTATACGHQKGGEEKGGESDDELPDLSV